MTNLLIAGLFLAHGIVHWSFKPTGRGALEGILPQRILVAPDLLWLLPVIAFVLAGFAVAGFIIPSQYSRALIMVAAAVSFVMLVIWHPWPWIGAGLDTAIIVGMIWMQSQPAS